MGRVALTRRSRRTVHNLKVLFDPCDKMVLICSLDDLMEEVWCKKFVDICSGKGGCKWLGLVVSIVLGQRSGRRRTRKSGTIPWSNHNVSSSSVSRSANISSRVRSSAAGSSRFVGLALQLKRHSSVCECCACATGTREYTDVTHHLYTVPAVTNCSG